uniref:SOCS box domain-containing protein n=1 Tax=Mesocestoides corti TaxID=53468 RepID=A0A5K3EMT0_MESCO
MTTRSLLDVLQSGDAAAFESLQSPLHRAESAVAKDDYAALRPLLALPGGGGGGPVTENLVVNSAVRENFLHYAVRQLAGYCVHVLVNPPYNWDPQRQNVLGASPLDLAMSGTAYLPVVWPLAVASPALPHGSTSSVTLADLLLRPPPHPFSHDAIDTICDRRAASPDYTLAAFNLLFDLIRCTPELMVRDWAHIAPQRCAECSASDSPGVASCLAADRPVDFPQRFSCWLWHRHLGGDKPTNQLSPLSLLECCRTVIRQEIMKGLVNDRQMNYASAIKSLSLPQQLRSFLAFRDLWPVCHATHKFNFRRQQQEVLSLGRYVYPF